MDKRQWRKVEAVLDQALSKSNFEEREEFIQERIEKEKVQKSALKWLWAIQEADEVGFMEG